MADTIEISCPECDKSMTLPAEMAGKKVRCKACGQVFRVEGAGPKASAKAVKAKADPKGKPSPKGQPDPKTAGKAKKKGAASDDEADPNPYGLTDEYLGPRCPFCAGQMEEGDIICLSCGYNTQSRVREQSKKVFERTGVDWFLWLFPAIMCVLIILFLVSVDVWYVMKTLTAEEEADFVVWAIFNKGVKLWVVIGTMFVMFFCARFAFKRLVFRPVPPEREKEDTRNIWIILGTLCLGIIIFLGTTTYVIICFSSWRIPSIYLTALGYSASMGMISGSLQYNV